MVLIKLKLQNLSALFRKANWARYHIACTTALAWSARPVLVSNFNDIFSPGVQSALITELVAQGFSVSISNACFKRLKLWLSAGKCRERIPEVRRCDKISRACIIAGRLTALPGVLTQKYEKTCVCWFKMRILASLRRELWTLESGVKAAQRRWRARIVRQNFDLWKLTFPLMQRKSTLDRTKVTRRSRCGLRLRFCLSMYV